MYIYIYILYIYIYSKCFLHLLITFDMFNFFDSTLQSDFLTSQHQVRGGQRRLSTCGGHFRARKHYFWTSNIFYVVVENPAYDHRGPAYDPRKAIYGPWKPMCALGGAVAPCNPFWQLRRASRWCKSMLNAGGARKASTRRPRNMHSHCPHRRNMHSQAF